MSKIREPVGARVGVTKSHRGPQREPVRVRGGVTESRRESERDWERAKGNQSELETTRKSHSESGRAHKLPSIVCQNLSKYALKELKKTAESALRTNSTLYPTLPIPKCSDILDIKMSMMYQIYLLL